MYYNKLRTLRNDLGLNQKELAQKVGLDNTLYNKYENDYNTIPLKHLMTLSNYFNVSLDYMFCFTDVVQYERIKKDVNQNSVGIRLKEFRKENKITQEKLANYLKTSRSVIADYERGRFLISTSFLYDICKRYKISADYLLGRIDSPKYLR